MLSRFYAPSASVTTKRHRLRHEARVSKLSPSEHINTCPNTEFSLFNLKNTSLRDLCVAVLHWQIHEFQNPPESGQRLAKPSIIKSIWITKFQKERSDRMSHGLLRSEFALVNGSGVH